MQQDPTLAIDAALEAEKQLDGITVYTLTLSRYALLELVESPFVTQGKDFTPLNLLDTFYIMTSDKSVLRQFSSKNIDELHAQAMDFGETLAPQTFSKLVDDVAAKFGLLNKIAPQAGAGDDASGKKKSSAATE